MDRRAFNKLAGLTALGAFASGAEMTAQQLAAAHEVVLEDQELLVAFDAVSGALTRMERKSTQWTIERRPALGISFRLHVPMPGRRANFVLGQKQKASVERISEHKVRIQWKDLINEHGGVLPIVFTATVTLNHGTLSFESTLQNDSSFSVESVEYPYLADLNAPTPDALMRAEHASYANLAGVEIHPRFGNEKGYWGVRFPTKTIDSSQSLACLLQTAEQGLYVGVHDPAIRYLVQFTFEQHPGLVSGIRSNVPADDEISGMPVHLHFRMCHFVFAQPHSTIDLAPVVMRAYSGDWHAGMDVYKEWRSTWFVPGKLPAWVKDVHSWMQLQLNGAEEDYSIPYRNIAKYAEECARHGVAAIQLVGWNRGGQDRGNPSHEPDPELGSRDDLRAAIAKTQAMGVKMILFGKFVWADMTTAWYRNELHQFAATDPYGIPYQHGGYSYTTPTQLAAMNNRRFAVMDVLSPGYRDIAVKEFQKLLDLGGSGWLFDQVCYHGLGNYNFSSTHGYAAPGYLYKGDVPMARQFRAAADKVDPEFLFAGEGPQDWLLAEYPCSYFRIDADTRHVSRYLDPQAPLVVAVTGFDDREMLNLILAYRYVISYEPYNFKGHLTDFPLTLAYGKKIDALRRRHRKWLWDAEFRDTRGAEIKADGGHRHTVFQTADGKRAVIVINEEQTKTITAELHLPNPGTLVVATPEDPNPTPMQGMLKIPPRSAAAVLEL